jgi:hypothetical protein
MKHIIQSSTTAAGSSGLLFPRFKSKVVNPAQSRRFKTPASKLVTDPTLPAKAVFPGTGPVVDPALSSYVRVYAELAPSNGSEPRRTTKKLQRSLSGTVTVARAFVYGISKLRQRS